MATLKDRLDKFKRTFESGAPPYSEPREAIAAMYRVTDELKASGIENAVMKDKNRNKHSSCQSSQRTGAGGMTNHRAVYGSDFAHFNVRAVETKRRHAETQST